MQKKENGAEDVIEVLCSLERTKFYKNGWGIAVMSINEIYRGAPKTDQYHLITVKGVMPQLEEKAMYHLTGSFVDDPKWGKQYNVTQIYRSVDFSNDEEGKKKFLLSLYTKKQVEAMYQALEDPYTTLANNDVVSLVTVKGCGMHKAAEWINKFNANIALGRIFTELSEYNLTNNMVERLMAVYNSPDIIIDKVKNNPYVLCTEVDGIGWKTADKIALDGGMAIYSPFRVGAYMRLYLRNCGEDGRSWIEMDELIGAVIEEMGDEITDEELSDALRHIKESLWVNDDCTEVGLKRYYNVERKIAENLKRLMSIKGKYEYGDWKDKVAHLEHAQGWKFTEEQIKAVETAIKNNVVVITGSAGTGKSTVVRAILEVLKAYPFAQTALSGRAASRMSEVTGKEGYTIHRLLGFPSNDSRARGMFFYNEENPLPYKIIVLDEVSMVNSYMFLRLVSAIPDGGKLICLGDPGQLEAIGEGNVAHDMIVSPDIPTVELTKIQRQASKSAIITESMKVRQGIQLFEEEWAGDEIRGELKDLELRVYSDSSNTFPKIIQAYKDVMQYEDYSVMGAQIVVPTKFKGAGTYLINNTIQELINSPTDDKNEVGSGFGDNRYVLREGDKVINTVNNYSSYTPSGDNCPIYNGSMGIIKEIHDDNMVIDFMGIGEVVVESSEYKNIELGYAITVHKSQGSEFDYVIFGLDYGAFALLSRELAYTGITRGKKKTIVVCQNSALIHAIKYRAVSYKQTFLVGLLKELFHPKIVF